MNNYDKDQKLSIEDMPLDVFYIIAAFMYSVENEETESESKT